MAKQKGWQIAWVQEMEEELKAKEYGKELSREEFDTILEKIAQDEAPPASQDGTAAEAA